MKTKTMLIASLLAAVLSAPAFAAAEGPPTTQQQRMKACNAEAKGKALKGDARRSFMSSCLKGHPAGGSASSEVRAARQ